MLHDSSSEGFRWLSELGTKYVVICSLGLDPELERRIRERGRGGRLFRTLTYYCLTCAQVTRVTEACHAILTQLKRFQCSLWLMQAVLEETAHHAEIADESFNGWYDLRRIVRRDYPNARPVDLLEVSDNAFVKGFAIAAGHAVKPTDWLPYIRQFRDRQHGGVVQLTGLLESELKAVFIADEPEVITGAKAFAERVKKDDYSAETANPQSNSLRMEWDARLLASSLQRQVAGQAKNRIVIASDSQALRTMFYRNVSVDRRRVIRIADPGRSAAPLAIVPDATVNLECVRHFLFGGHIKLSMELQAHDVLARVFSDASRFLRKQALGERLDDALAGVEDQNL